jgi:hypothetical protein
MMSFDSMVRSNGERRLILACLLWAFKIQMRF